MGNINFLARISNPPNTINVYYGEYVYYQLLKFSYFMQLP